MLLQKDGPKILQAFSSALNEAGIKFWIDYGTLLGYYRDHDFIGHDNDLDSGAFIEDTDRVKDVLENRGFRLVRYYRTEDGDGIEHCYAFEDLMQTGCYMKSPKQIKLEEEALKAKKAAAKKAAAKKKKALTKTKTSKTKKPSK